MIDQAEETRQIQIETNLIFHLNKIYTILQEWDAEGYEEMAEDMNGFVSKWKAKLEGDTGTFDE